MGSKPQGRCSEPKGIRAGTDRRTLKEKESAREDEPFAQVKGDGERRNTTWPFGNEETARGQATRTDLLRSSFTKL